MIKTLYDNNAMIIIDFLHLFQHYLVFKLQNLNSYLANNTTLIIILEILK